MGALQSRSFSFQSDFAIYQACVDSIETKHPIQVYRNIMNDDCFLTLKQMEAVVIIIYEKAVLNSRLSLKCAQLVKELEAERVIDDNNKSVTFNAVFDRYLMNLIHSIIDNYNDNKMTDYAVQRGKSIAIFIGNLFVVDALVNKLLIEIGQAAKRKETKNNKFFINTIWSTIAKIMESRHEITFEIFQKMISEPVDVRNVSVKNDPEYVAATRFCSYLQKISNFDRYEFYEHFEDFRTSSDETMRIQITSFLGHALKKPAFIIVYRDLALEIYYMRPDETKNCLKNFLIESIERYQVIVDLGINENLNELDSLGTLVIEFYNTGLINNEILEMFMKVTKSSTILIEIFNYVFVEVLPKYRGQFVNSYIQHSKKCTMKMDMKKILVPIMEEYVKGRDMEMKSRSERNACERTVADLPDFRDYSSKCLTLAESFDPKSSKTQPIFICEDRPSCHFASVRGLEILKRHIGHKFFTPERIEICTKMTGDMVKFQIGYSFADNIKREMNTYLPYTQGHTEPTRKVRNFSNLLASCYSGKFIERAIVISWLNQITEKIGSTTDEFEKNFKDIFSEFFQKVSSKLESENSFVCRNYSDLLESLEERTCCFHDFFHFKDIVSGCWNPDTNVLNLKKFKMITIPNDKFAMKLVCKHLLSLFSDNKISIPALVPIISMLPTQTKHEIDKNLLRSEFQDALCITLGEACASYEAINGKAFINVKRVIDLIEALCIKTLITRLGLANLLRIMVDIMDMNPHPIPELISYFNQKMFYFFLGTKSMPIKVEKIICEVIEKIKNGLRIQNIDLLNIKEAIALLELMLIKSKDKRIQEESKESTKNGQDTEKSSKTEEPTVSTDIVQVQKSQSDPKASANPSTATAHSVAEKLTNIIKNSTDSSKSSVLPNNPTANCEGALGIQAEPERNVTTGQSKSASQLNDPKPSTSSFRAKEKKQKQAPKSEQILKNDKDLRDSSVSPPASTAETSKSSDEPDRNVTTGQTKSSIQQNQAESDSIVQSKSASQSNDPEPSTSSSIQTLTPNQPQPQNDQQSTQTQPKKTQKDIKDYQDYCDYFNSIDHKTSDDDKFFFNPNFISTINIKNKEQVIDLAKKIIDQVLAAQSTVIFFVQNAQKIGNAIQSMFKLKNQKISFQKILADEICLKFENQEVLVKFMCELYNNSYVNKASMIAFVDKFKSQSPENLVLMHTFVRTCAIRLSSQGDKEQLMQIRTIARSIKNLTNYDEDLKFLAQDLASSTNSLILLLENGQNSKPQVVTESNEKLVDELLKNVLNNPQIYVKSAYKLDGKLKELLIQKIENIIKEVPKFSIKLDEFMNLIEFVAELYNLEFFKKDFLTKTIEIFMQSSTNETCSQSIEVLFTKCGQKLEIVNQHKFDIYMKFFEAVLVKENDTIRSECFKRILKLRNRKWKILDIPKNYYEDFLMLFSMNDAKIEELIEIINCDDEEMEKFIQILWKIILKEAPHPFYAILCDELSKNCENFKPKLTQFFTTRCITFIGFTADMFNENVKERLGKVMTFVAEIYNNNLASDELLEMYLDQKLTSKLPTEFVTRIFSILSKCGRLEESKNDRLKVLVKNFDDFYHRGIDAQLESIRKGLDSISKRVI